MIQITDKKSCCGCTACVHICPQQCISFSTDGEGFNYPTVNIDKCIDCRLCDKVCPVLHWSKQPKLAIPTVYAATVCDQDVLINSTSGGVFSVLANRIINDGGVIYGAVYDSRFRVIHCKAESIEDIVRMRGSKYVQSDLQNVFPEIERELKEGRKVLFTGVPCQVAALKLFLRKEYEFLYTTDLICHGVPSPKVFADYISFVQQKKKLSAINMRRKGLWKHSSCMLFYTDGSSVKDVTWRRLYNSEVMKRPSCHQCEFTHLNRVGDITIADYWGIEKSHPNFFNKMGVSLVLVSTEKGKHLFDAIRTNLSIELSDCDKCIQPRLLTPPNPSPLRNSFWKDYEQLGFNFIIKKYAGYGWFNKLKRVPKQIGLKLLKYLQVI